MKKICILLIALFILLPIIALNGKNYSVSAEEYYSFDCGNEYEVSYITDDGKFTKVACYANFSDAKNKMNELGGDHVVRHSSSLSPTKIVAMVSGNAYSYPARNKDNTSTLSIYQHSDIRDPYQGYKQTYIANHYEMNYIDTDRYYPSVNGGLIKVYINGFEGYTDLEYTDLVPSKFIDKQLPIYLGGNDKSSLNEQPFLVIVRRNYYSVVENNNRRELVYTYHRSYCKPENVNKLDEEFNIVLGLAPDEMTTGAKYYSNNGYDFYTTADYKNIAVTYYPYFQFLPLRSKTNLTSDDLNKAFKAISNSDISVIKDAGAIFIEAQDKYGINALLLYAMAAHESAWGTSYYARTRNNLFGWNAIDGDPNQAASFSTVQDCVFDHAGYNLRLYLDITDPRFFGSSLGNKGSGLNVKYASDPYWGMKISSIAYQIDRYISGNGDLKDTDFYSLSLINKFDVDFKKEANKDSSVLYTSQYGPYYQENFIVINLGEDGNFTKVQSTNPIADDGKVIVRENTLKQRVEYSYTNSVAYIATDVLVSLNRSDIIDIKPTGEYVANIKDMSWDNDKLYISGDAYMPGIVVDEENTITNIITVYDSANKKEYSTVSKTEDGVTGYAASLDLSSLNEGTYNLKIKTSYSKYSKFNSEAVLNSEIKIDTIIINGYKYIIQSNTNGITINKTKYDNASSTNISAISELKLVDNLLTIKGKAFRTSQNYSDLTKISYKLQVIEIESDEIIKEYALSVKDSGSFSLNDGFDYKYTSFEGKIDLSNLIKGTYRFVVVVNNDNNISKINLRTTNSDYSLVFDDYGDVTYKITTNPLYSYRIELDVESKVFDYSLINKPSIRNSIVSYTALNLKNGKLNIDGYAWIYYVNFSAENMPNYNLYLVSNDGNLIDIGNSTTACKYNYTEIFESKRSLDNICFSTSYDLKDLKPGIYEIKVGINVTDEENYYDIISLIDRQVKTYEPYENDDRIYSLKVDKVRNTIKLYVETKEGN